MIFGTANNHPINMVPCLLCVGELLQDEHADPFASSITIGLSREGFAASIFTEHACFAKTNMKFRGNQNIDAADDSHSTLSTLDCLPHIHHQEPLLRIHLLGFAGRDPEELGIKQLDAIQYPSPFDICLIHLSCCRVAEIALPIPARGRNCANTVTTSEQIAPQALHIRSLGKRAAHADDSNG